ncbi:hypothetical protein MMC30_004078 [Trapelia coarctata]|nr:hypothetical protein [Trapelia coarctata]
MSGLSPEELRYQEAHIQEDRGPWIVGVSIFLIVLCTVAVTLRFVARWIRRLPWKADDYAMLPALLFTALLCAENILSVRYGNGKHLTAVDPRNLEGLLKIIYFLSITYANVHFWVKISILLLYRRIFATFHRGFRIALHITGAYVTAWALATLLTSIFQCWPLSYFWEQYTPGTSGSCIINSIAAEITVSILSTITDVVLVILPMTVIFKLQLSSGRKYKLAAVFSAGAFACAASVIRIYTMSWQKEDITWDSTQVLIWTAVEPAVGIVSACFPVILPAFQRRAFAERFSSSSCNSAGINLMLQKLFSPRSSASLSKKERASSRGSEDIESGASQRTGSAVIESVEKAGGEGVMS